MRESEYLHGSHCVTNLVYHIVCPCKYRRIVVSGGVDESLRQICAGIELRYSWMRFLEIGTDRDHVHFLVQGTPERSVSEIVRTLKSVSARRKFAEHPEVKKQLWGGEFWSDGYFASTVGKYTSENVIRNYEKSQGRQDEYVQLYFVGMNPKPEREDTPAAGLGPGVKCPLDT